MTEIQNLNQTTFVSTEQIKNKTADQANGRFIEPIEYHFSATKQWATKKPTSDGLFVAAIQKVALIGMTVISLVTELFRNIGSILFNGVTAPINWVHSCETMEEKVNIPIEEQIPQPQVETKQETPVSTTRVEITTAVETHPCRTAIAAMQAHPSRTTAITAAAVSYVASNYAPGVAVAGAAMGCILATNNVIPALKAHPYLTITGTAFAIGCASAGTLNVAVASAAFAKIAIAAIEGLFLERREILHSGNRQQVPCCESSQIAR